MAVIMYLVINTLLTDDWSYYDRVQLLPERKPARVVISMSTFARRLQTTGLRVIQDLMKRQRYDRMIVTVSLAHRNSTGHCIYKDCVMDETVVPVRTVQQCLDLLEVTFGHFQAITPSSERPDVLPYENCKLYLQIMTAPDYGPATKLLGALIAERDPDTVIVTVDDDIFYFANYISQLAYHIPQNGTLGSFNQHIGPGPSVQSMINPKLWLVIWNGYGIRFEGWLMGFGGIAYRRSYFDDSIFAEARKLSYSCFINDDVWLGGYLKKRGYSTYVHLGLSVYNHQRHATESLSTLEGAINKHVIACAEQYHFPFAG